jgi:AraC family transcriptional regulator of adaptative response/methylated-DNA-[protein]-cysteine methyltransferase
MTPNSSEQFWAAVQRRDASWDGKFLYGVVTTGVFCRPGCPGRTPNRANVRFYQTPAEAERDGLRACLRCRPLALTGADPWTERITALCRFIDSHADSELSLADLSREAGLSPYHLQRGFRAIVGVTPKQYIDAWRARKFKAILRAKHSPAITSAIYEAGFGSSSRLYERADTRLGMTPMEYRSGGRGVEITHAAVETPLGLMVLGATDRGLCFLQFGDSAEALTAALRAEYPAARVVPMPDPAPPQFDEWIGALNRHLEGTERDLRLPVHVAATAFQLQVWQYLQSIPAGSVRSYSEVAAGIGRPKAVRAVASACASNRVALAIPCHRVIRGTGELGGYRWGLERKRVLLDAERAQASGSSMQTFPRS